MLLNTFHLGTLIASIGMCISDLNFSMLLLLLFFGFFITAFFSLPNIIALNLGLKYIYRNAKNEGEKRHYFVYFWMILCAIPLLLYVSMNRYDIFFSNPNELLSTLLMPLPYLLSSLYFIFKINNKYDKIYPPNFSKNKEISIDVLDDNF
jgi:hypothetical protein